MGEVPESREFSESTVEEMVRLVDPDWTLERLRPADRGFCSVYELAVAGDGRTRELYLKASPDGEAWSVPTEARLQAVLTAHTSIPVPEIVGVVDAHDRLPTPFFLMESLPGEELAYERVGDLDDDVLRRLARDTGEHLGELHSIPAVEAFGHVRHDGPVLTGDRPAGTPTTLTVGDPHDDWRTVLEGYAERELDRHADSRFSHRTPELRRWFEAGVEELEGPFDAVLGRNDHGLHNLLLDPATGAVTATLDWGYTLAVPASFDVEFAVYLLSGAFLAGLPDVEDRRSLVREATLAGYRQAAPARADAVSTPEPLYEALAMVRIMNDFDHLDLPEGTETAAMDRIETDLDELLGVGG